MAVEEENIQDETIHHEIPHHRETAESHQENLYITAQQSRAIDALLMGKSITETARSIGCSRETLSRWKNNNPNFIAEFNRRQQEAIEDSTMRLRALFGKAVDVFEGAIESKNFKAAVELLKVLGIYGKMPEPSKETDAERILRQRAKDIAINETVKLFFGGNDEDRIRKNPPGMVKDLADDIYKMEEAKYNLPNSLEDILAEAESLETASEVRRIK